MHLNNYLKDAIVKNQDVKKNIVNVFKTIYHVPINVDVMVVSIVKNDIKLICFNYF